MLFTVEAATERASLIKLSLRMTERERSSRNMAWPAELAKWTPGVVGGWKNVLPLGVLPLEVRYVCNEER